MTISLLPDQDGDCSASLRAALDGTADETVTLDLELVPYLSATALAAMAQFHRLAGRTLILARPNPVVLRTLTIVGFSKLFAIEPAPAAIMRQAVSDGRRPRAGASR